ncbi:MAG: hypothetical protein ABMA00_10040 [Gemmatimonas sp.]
MTRSLRTVTLALLCVIPCAMDAQVVRATSVGASGGLSLPMGDLGDIASSGFSVAGYLFLKPASRDKLLFRGDVSYDRWGAKSTLSSVTDATLSGLGFVGNVMVSAGGAKAGKRPYLLLGGGIYRTKLSLAGTTGGLISESSDMGVQVGVGLTYLLSGMSTFLEAKYVNVFRDPTSWTYLPITVGVRF